MKITPLLFLTITVSSLFAQQKDSAVYIRPFKSLSVFDSTDLKPFDKPYYLGMRNIVLFKFNEEKVNKLNIETTNGLILKEKNKTWVYYPKDSGITKITIAVINLNGEQIKGTFNAYVKPLPNPHPIVAGLKGGSMSAISFREAKEIKFDDDSWEITSFVIYFTGAGFEEYPFVAVQSGNTFTNKSLLEVISKCKPGTTVVFDEIKGKPKNATSSSIVNIIPGAIVFELF